MAEPDLCEDRAWLDAFRAGDKAALERVFRAYGPLVIHFMVRGVVLSTGARAFVTNHAEQDDLAQDVFSRLFDPANRTRYDGLHPYAAFVRVIARNVLVDHLRRQGRTVDRLAAMNEHDLEALTAPPPHADQVLLDKEEDRLARAFLDGLTPEERAFVAVRFEQGLSQRDAAEKLGLTRQTVRTQEDRIRDKMAAFLAQHDPPT